MTDDVNKPVPWIIEDLISEGEQMLVFGAPKVGKSQFVLQMAISVALGNDFHKWRASIQGEGRKVLYVNLEIGERSFMRRIADHVIAEAQLGARPDSKKEIPIEMVEGINELIAGKLFFSEGMRTVGMTNDLIDEILKAEDKGGKVAAHRFVDKWHASLDEMKPDLIIFDTLSKMHSLDERNNNEIQGVLSVIRKISTVQSGDIPDERKELAHVIVHHSRKSSENSISGGELSLDSIRGGSSIRAEADVIVGIFARKDKYVVQAGKTMPRDVLIEARNIEGDRVDFQFDGVRFRLTTAQDVKEAKEGPITQIRGIFEELGVRGISSGVLATKLAARLNPEYKEEIKPNSSKYQESKRYLTKFAKEGKHLELITKKHHGDLIRRSPVQGKRTTAYTFYWIRDTSGWLEIESISNAMAEMEKDAAEDLDSAGKNPATRGKSGKGKKPSKKDTDKPSSKRA
ncbi:MAG: AAA family ATPase [Luteolibacter sp.]